MVTVHIVYASLPESRGGGWELFRRLAQPFLVVARQSLYQSLARCKAFCRNATYLPIEK